MADLLSPPPSPPQLPLEEDGIHCGGDDDAFLSNSTEILWPTELQMPLSPQDSVYLNEDFVNQSLLDQPLDDPPTSQSPTYKDMLISDTDPMWSSGGPLVEIEVDEQSNELAASSPPWPFSSDSQIDEWLAYFGTDFEMEDEAKVTEPVDQEATEEAEKAEKAEESMKNKEKVSCQELAEAKQLKRLQSIPLSVYSRWRMTITKVKISL